MIHAGQEARRHLKHDIFGRRDRRGRESTLVQRRRDIRISATCHGHGARRRSGVAATLVGGAYDNALAETTIGLYKTECIRDDSPFRRGPLTGLSTLEAITADWVHWYNTSRLMHRLGRRPPAEAEADYHAQTRDHQPVVHT